MGSPPCCTWGSALTHQLTDRQVDTAGVLLSSCEITPEGARKLVNGQIVDRGPTVKISSKIRQARRPWRSRSCRSADPDRGCSTDPSSRQGTATLPVASNCPAGATFSQPRLRKSVVPLSTTKCDWRPRIRVISPGRFDVARHSGMNSLYALRRKCPARLRSGSTADPCSPAGLPLPA